jgi:hypothetical protein
MALGKSISLFLIDGTPSGPTACELSNWTGKAYKIPRNRLKECADRKDLGKAGVYFLFGRVEQESDQILVYVGEAEEVYNRLVQHQQERDFWNEALIFISKDENLNKAHIKFLEHKACAAILSAQRASLQNSNTPNCPVISEAEQAVMAEFLENLKLLTGTLGYKVFERLIQTASKEIIKTSTEKVQHYFIKAARGADAKGIVTSEGFVVTQGSGAALDCVASSPERLVNIREKLIETGILVRRDGQMVFMKDHLFSSPSAAAATVMGRSANGFTEWRDNKSRTLKENESRK